jgi:hypothetical protein
MSTSRADEVTGDAAQAAPTPSAKNPIASIASTIAGPVLNSLARSVFAGMDTSAAARSVLAGMAGMDTSAAARSVLAGMAGMDTSAAAKSMFAGMAGLDTRSMVKTMLAGLDTSAAAKSMFAGMKGADSLTYFVDKWVDDRRISSVFSAEPATADDELASPPCTDFSIYGLTREQARKAFGNYMYVATLVVIVELAIIVMMSGSLSSNLLNLGTLVTGFSGHSIASAAQTLAQRAFDLRYPE